MKRTTATLAALAASGLIVAGAAVHATASPSPSLGPVAATSARAVAGLASLATNPVAYADDLVRAWGRGDHRTVGELATASAARALFAYSDPGGVSWRRTGSQGAAGTIYVSYHDDARGGTVTVGVSDVLLSEGRQHAAYEVRFSQSHPIGPVQYADRLVRAWGRGDRTAAGTYATRRVVAILFDHADPSDGHWRRVAASGAAGSTYVTYRDDQRGGRLVVAVHNAAEQDGQRHAVYDARFTH